MAQNSVTSMNLYDFDHVKSSIQYFFRIDVMPPTVTSSVQVMLTSIIIEFWARPPATMVAETVLLVVDGGQYYTN